MNARGDKSKYDELNAKRGQQRTELRKYKNLLSDFFCADWLVLALTHTHTHKKINQPKEAIATAIEKSQEIDGPAHKFQPIHAHTSRNNIKKSKIIINKTEGIH